MFNIEELGDDDDDMDILNIETHNIQKDKS